MPSCGMVIMSSTSDSLTLDYKLFSSTAPASGMEVSASTIVVINKNQFLTDAICRSINDATQAEIAAFTSVESWLEHRAAGSALVLIYLSSLTKEEEQQQLDLLLSQAEDAPPVVVLGDREIPACIMGILAKGARGYIPTSLSLALTLKALQLVRAGGVFLPASCLQGCQAPPQWLPAPANENAAMFTERQIAVIEAIRLGKANKMIAYELNMCESTVKVHVRNIMKKLRATNRTQISFIADRMLKEGLLVPKAK
jgi:DNA-binding NarL/FixJ family response regulator